MAVPSRDLPGTPRTHPLTPLLTAVTYADILENGQWTIENERRRSARTTGR
jgi:hypothetical protein